MDPVTITIYEGAYYDYARMAYNMDIALVYGIARTEPQFVNIRREVFNQLMQEEYDGTGIPPPTLEDVLADSTGRRLLAQGLGSRQLRGGSASSASGTFAQNQNPSAITAT